MPIPPSREASRRECAALSSEARPPRAVPPEPRGRSARSWLPRRGSGLRLPSGARLTRRAFRPFVAAATRLWAPSPLRRAPHAQGVPPVRGCRDAPRGSVSPPARPSRAGRSARSWLPRRASGLRLPSAVRLTPRAFRPFVAAATRLGAPSPLRRAPYAHASAGSARGAAPSHHILTADSPLLRSGRGAGGEGSASRAGRGQGTGRPPQVLDAGEAPPRAPSPLRRPPHAQASAGSARAFRPFVAAATRLEAPSPLRRAPHAHASAGSARGAAPSHHPSDCSLPSPAKRERGRG